YFLGISPGWFETMKIPLIDGRDFRPDDFSPHVAIVNEKFAATFFDGQNPVGKSFEKVERANKRSRYEIVGYVRDARYRNMREAIRPTDYVPYKTANEKTGWGTFIVRPTAANPMSLAPFLRKEIPRLRSEFRVSNIRTQTELVHSHTVRERLL